MSLNNNHTNEWFESKQAEFLPYEFSKLFNDYLMNEVEWNTTGTGLNWSKYNNINIDLSKVSDDELIEIIRLHTLIGNDPYLVFWYSSLKPCFATLLDFGILNIDAAFWKAPGKRYMFGASRDKNIWYPKFDHIIEYNGSNKIIAKSY